MKYKWLTLLSITFFLFTSCQSVKDFFKIGENSKNKQAEVSSLEQGSLTVDDVLNRLPQFGLDVDSLLDGLRAVVDGCVRLAERPADFDERTRGELAGEEHCNLTRRDERLRAFL